MVADRWGAFRVIVVGSVLYALGLVTMALATSGLAFTGSAGLLLGIAQSGTTYAVIYGVIARNVAPEKRSWAMGVAAAAGSFGQFLFSPLAVALMGAVGWHSTLLIFAAMLLLVLPLAFVVASPGRDTGASSAVRPQSLREALG